MSNIFWKSFSVLVTVLFEDEKSKHSVFMSACKNGDVEIVQLILDCTEFDPSEASMYVEYGDKNGAIRWACCNGHIAVVDRLIQDRRVDPSGDDDGPIKISICQGYTDIVYLLLQDARVDPSANNNWAIRVAKKSVYTDVINLVLQDPRYNKNLTVKSYEY